MNVMLKGQVYKTVVRPAMTYSSETWPMKRSLEKKMNVAEMRMLRWMTGVTRTDRIRNEYVKGTTKVAEVSRKVQERRLHWFGHVMRREEEYVRRRLIEMEVPVRKRRGWLTIRWKDCVNGDMREKGINVDTENNRAEWWRLSRNSHST